MRQLLNDNRQIISLAKMNLSCLFALKPILTTTSKPSHTHAPVHMNVTTKNEEGRTKNGEDEFIP